MNTADTPTRPNPKSREVRNRRRAQRMGFRVTKTYGADLWTIMRIATGDVVKVVQGVDALEAELDQLSSS